MGIRLVTFYNSTVTPQDDALIYENALPASGMIYGGNVTIKNANTLHISAGHGALCGRKFTIEEDDIPIILTSSGTLNGRLYIHMDLSDTGEPISLEVERANVLTPVVQQSNVNINDGIYEINLATFTISTSTVSDLNYVAPFIRDLDAREVIIAPVEPTNIASSNYAIGRRLILNKVLYRVTATITAGQTIAPGTNVTESNSVEEQIEANLSSINTINSNKLNQSVIATRQSNLIASKAYVIGEQFVYNNILYRATAAIAKNATITIGGNATTADDISTQISNLANPVEVSYSWKTVNLTNQSSKIYRIGKILFFYISCTGTVGANGAITYLFETGLSLAKDVSVRPYTANTNNGCRIGLTTDGKCYINGNSQITSNWSDDFRCFLVGILS